MYLAAGDCDSNIDGLLLYGNPQDSSSVIQFVARGNVQVKERVVEVPEGLPEEISVSTSLVINKINLIQEMSANHTSSEVVLLLKGNLKMF